MNPIEQNLEVPLVDPQQPPLINESGKVDLGGGNFMDLNDFDFEVPLSQDHPEGHHQALNLDDLEIPGTRRGEGRRNRGSILEEGPYLLGPH